MTVGIGLLPANTAVSPGGCICRLIILEPSKLIPTVLLLLTQRLYELCHQFISDIFTKMDCDCLIFSANGSEDFALLPDGLAFVSSVSSCCFL